MRNQSDKQPASPTSPRSIRMLAQTYRFRNTPTPCSSSLLSGAASCESHGRRAQSSCRTAVGKGRLIAQWVSELDKSNGSCAVLSGGSFAGSDAEAGTTLVWTELVGLRDVASLVGTCSFDRLFIDDVA